MNDLFVAFKAKISSWLTNSRAIPNKLELKAAYVSFPKKVQLLLLCLAIIGTITLVSSLILANKNSMTQIATSGGSMTEGMVGPLRFINPILATYDTDRDMTNLVYSGLLRREADGSLTTDLAKKYEVSTDGKRYTFTLKPDLTWHDDQPLTSDDIEFTISKAQDPLIKSPRRANWQGVSVEKPDAQTIVFVLEQPYIGFLENLTIGILPKHLWSDVTPDNFPFSDLNTNPIGSGPYLISKMKKDSTGIPQYYNLEPFSNFALGKPRISIVINIYPNETERLLAYETGAINSMAAISPEVANNLKLKNARVEESPLPRIFAIFFNQNQAPVLANKEVRLALDTAINKDTLVTKVLLGHGLPLNGPTQTNQAPKDNYNENQKIEQARAILEQAGWTKNTTTGIYEKIDSKKKTTTTLSLSLSTSDTPELKKAGEIIQNIWKKVGVDVELKVFETGTLQQTAIRPRKYDALLFGQVVSKNQGLFAFWHSSQRLDPGLNIAQYTNLKVDKWLDSSRTTLDSDQSKIDQNKAIQEIQNDLPAIFLYAPYFIYVIPDEIKNLKLNTLQTTSDRFNEIHKTFINTESIWKIFASSNNIIKQ